MIVRFRLIRFSGDVREFSAQRRDTWLPAPRFREKLLANVHGHVWADYVLDRRASSERGVLVYRQVMSRAFGAEL